MANANRAVRYRQGKGPNSVTGPRGGGAGRQTNFCDSAAMAQLSPPTGKNIGVLRAFPNGLTLARFERRQSARWRKRGSDGLLVLQPVSLDQDQVWQVCKRSGMAHRMDAVPLSSLPAARVVPHASHASGAARPPAGIRTDLSGPPVTTPPAERPLTQGDFHQATVAEGPFARASLNQAAVPAGSLLHDARRQQPDHGGWRRCLIRVGCLAGGRGLFGPIRRRISEPGCGQPSRTAASCLDRSTD